MAKYSFGGGISGEANKVARRKALKFEDGKRFAFKSLDKPYVDFLSCLRTLKTKEVKSKADGSWKLQGVIFTMLDKKTGFWHGVDQKPKVGKKA